MRHKHKTRCLPILLCLNLALPGLALADWLKPGVTLPEWLASKLSPEHRGLLPPAAQVWLLSHQGKPAYYLEPPCCDMAGRVYSEAGDYLCSAGAWSNPNLTKRCSDVGIEPHIGTLIWALKKPPGDPLDELLKRPRD